MKKNEFYSPHFTLRELTRSRDYPFVPNDPPPEALDCLQSLCDNILEPLRQAWMGKIYVTSGYRSPRLNHLVGGVRSSQHVLGQAADITVHDCVLNARLGDLIQRLQLPFDQLIYEHWNGGMRLCDWVHVSFGPRNRREVLFGVRRNGRMEYRRAGARARSQA